MISRIRKALLRRTRRIARLFGPRVNSVQGISEQRFLQRFSGASANAGVSDLLHHFGHRVASDWPAIPDMITDLRIDLSRMSDNEIIQRADAALDGELHPSGLRPRYSDQGELDWAYNPAESREWLLMIHRHGWWPLWGAAYQRSGDEKYARAFVAQLLDWIDKNPLPKQMSEHSSSWRLMEAGLRMRISWVPSFGCFYESEAFSDAAKLKMLRAFYDHGQFLNKFFTNRNHLVRESNGLLALALSFSEFADATRWVDAATSRLDLELRSQVNADGSHLEMSVGYQWLTVIEFEVTRALLHQFKRESAIEVLDDTLRKMYEVLAAVIRPDRSFPQLNDGFILWDAQQLAETARQRGWGDIEYAASAGESGMQPGFCSRSFPNAGIHVMRSDWTPEARYLVADTGPYGGPHGHEDKLSFELCAFGARFIVDPGSYTYSRTDPLREYFVGSQGHNTVLVDGGSQVRRWNPQHMTPAVEDVVHGTWRSDNKLDTASGRYDEGYAPFAIVRPEAAKILLDITHRRDFVFAKPDYWVVADHLSSNDLHDYTFLFHLAPDVVVEEISDAAAIVRSTTNGARLVIKALSDHDLSANKIEGWYSEDHHKKCASPVLSFVVEQAGSASVSWVLYPLPPAADAADVSASTESDPEAGCAVIRVQSSSRSDRIRLSRDAGVGTVLLT